MSELVALRRKYAALAAWRAQKQRDGTEPDRAALRALATEFPGALREIEVLSEQTLAERIDALDRCIAGHAPPALWMRAMDAFHRWMRAALWLKRRARSRALDRDAIHDLARDSSGQFGLLIDSAWVQSVLTPHDGRMRPLVIAAVAAALGVETSSIAHIVLHRDSAIDLGNSAANELIEE